MAKVIEALEERGKKKKKKKTKNKNGGNRLTVEKGAYSAVREA